MKFDYCIGNPPYQKETNTKDIEKGQNPSISIFHLFQKELEKMSGKTCLIYPAARWIQRTGKGLKQFGLEQINDKHLEELIVYPNPFDVFPGIRIGDGVSIVIKNMERESDTFDYVYIRDGEMTKINIPHPGEDLLPLNPKDFSIQAKIKKFIQKYNLNTLNDVILSQKLFGIESCYVEDNPDKVKLYNEGDKLENDEIKLFTNDVAGKGGTPHWYIINRNNIPKNQEIIDKYKVIGSSVNISSVGHMQIFPPKTAFGRSRICYMAFDTQEEANNFYKYITSKFIIYTLMISGGSLTSGGKITPNLANYLSNNIFDFSKDIDEQYKQILNITNEEWEYIINYKPIYV